MQKKLYTLLKALVNAISVASLFLPLPKAQSITAGLICFADWWISALSKE